MQNPHLAADDAHDAYVGKPTPRKKQSWLSVNWGIDTNRQCVLVRHDLS